MELGSQASRSGLERVLYFWWIVGVVSLIFYTLFWCHSADANSSLNFLPELKELRICLFYEGT